MATLKLYEQLLTKYILNKLDMSNDEHQLFLEELDREDSTHILALYLMHAVEHGLRHYQENRYLDEKILIANDLIERLKVLTEDDSFDEWLIQEAKVLRGVGEKPMREEVFWEMIPQTSVSKTSLFTGNRNEPQVYRELKREIATADSVDLLVSFIKHSGLRLIYDDLVEHTKTKRLRVITTSYMGATDYKAIKLLAELPNTEVRISYDTKRTRLHAKAYYFDRDTGFSTAYIGSSNLSRAALSEGTEWNLKVSEYTSFEIIQKLRFTFETYWNMPEFMVFDPASAKDHERLKTALANESQNDENYQLFDLRPFSYQEEILEELQIEREVHGSYRNLIVAATGTGKTMVAAFDFHRYCQTNPNAKLLFLAHREEILRQSLHTFRMVLKNQNVGERWENGREPTEYKHVFASIQMLNLQEKYKTLEKTHFDYIVLDETHHGAASSYQKVIQYFHPEILLGMTATPERMDGRDILSDFNHRIAYEMRLSEAIDQNLLCPFHYFGITDTTDTSQVQWLRGRYSPDDLSVTYISDHGRRQAILDAVHKYVTDLEAVKGLGFCVDQKHAAYMAMVFNAAGIPSEALDANTPKEQRKTVQKRLKTGEIKFIFVVDLYNEGVDIPHVNTVLFLRPTESATVFVQQLGRGLRLYAEKDVLTVLDFVGQVHQNYDYRMKLQKLIGRTHHSIKQEVELDFPSVPRNCVIHFERFAKDYVLANIKQQSTNLRKLRQMVTSFKADANMPLEVEHFLHYFDLLPGELYKASTFMDLLNPGITIDLSSPVAEIANRSKAMGRVAKIDDVGQIRFLLGYLAEPRKELSMKERRMLLAFYYTLFDKEPSESLYDIFMAMKQDSGHLYDECMSLLSYGRHQAKHMPKTVPISSEVPLELHATYSIQQVFSALGLNTERNRMLFREGVKFVKNYNLDVFFVTLKKSEKHFTETTRYEDYAISDTLFHWQSQSRTSESSPTGQRYIHQKTNRSRVLLFVRESKNDVFGATESFTCLGLADYVTHRGSAPISIEYRLREKMPIRILRESNRYVDLG